MKLNFKRISLFASLIVLICLLHQISQAQSATTLKGAWLFQNATTDYALIFADGYYAYAEFDKGNKEFKNSSGGTLQVSNNQLTTKVEFDSQDGEEVGKSNAYPYTLSGDVLTIEVGGNQVPFSKIDDGSGPLAGNWQITGRMQDGKQVSMNPGARKTLKIMSGSRFQWFAINPETKEFFGTGGGTYSFKDGKYTENIEYFSRDSSRVGTSLAFDDKVVNGEWHHAGKSSTGDPIHEIWTKVK